MKIMIPIIATSLALFASSFILLPENDDRARDANVVAAQEPRGTKPKAARPAKAQTEREVEVLKFDEYVARRKLESAATTKVDVDPRWEFSPRQALESLGEARLVYAVAPTDTGANEVDHINEKRPRHFGLTVWDVKSKTSQASLGVACMRLVGFTEDAAPTVPPDITPYLYWSRVFRKDKILAKQDFRICGRVVRLTRYLPYGQCNVPFLEHWDAAFATGGWAVYLQSTFHEGSDAEAAALDVVRAADLVTDALRMAKVGLDRPKFETYRFEGILWGNQKVTFAFSLEPARGNEICANLWNRVPTKYSKTGIWGYGTRIIKVSGQGRIHGEVTAGNHMRVEGFQLDWANELGVGGSILHELKRLPALIEDLKHEDIQVRIDAVFALGPRGPSGVPALMGALKDKERRVRRVAAIVLGRIGPPPKDAVPALIGVLNDEDENVRYPAVVALRRMGPAAKEAVPILEVMCESDPDPKVRRAATEALKRIGHQKTDPE